MISDDFFEPETRIHSVVKTLGMPQHHPLNLMSVNTQPLENTPFIAPYVPCPDFILRPAIDFAAVTHADVMVDLGCGDGRLCHAAVGVAKRVVGVELDPYLAAMARERLGQTGQVLECDLFSVSLNDLCASVVIVYLLPAGLEKLKDRFGEWFSAEDGRRVVTVEYAIPGWTAVKTERIECDGRARTLRKYNLTSIV